VTPATTGTTSTRAAVAMLRCDRRGTMAAPRPIERAIPTIDPATALRTRLLSYESGLPTERPA
jgi:hypothetical protein